ncbi:MAG: hypothetical protein CMF57_06900 [Leifsonia sp.]|nr:hypothetical protein [Leifsonia sp.]
MRKTSATLGLVAVTGVLLSGCSAAGGDSGSGGTEPILIAQVGDYSGDFSFYDVPFRDGMQIAVDEVNAAGGVNGQQLEFMTIDGRGDQAESVRGVEEALDAGAVYISGTTASGAWQAQAAVACDEGVPITTGDGSSPTLVLDAGDCAYHVLMLDTLQGAVGAEYALDQGYENAYVLLSSDDAYTAGLGAYFADAFAEGGGTVLAEEEFRIGASDYSVQVTNIAAQNPTPDVIYLSMFTPDTPQFLRQLRASGIDAPVISGDGSVDASVLEAGAAAEGLVATFHAWPSEGNETSSFLETNFPEADISSAPQNIVSAAGYDEVMIMVQAMEAAGEATPAAIMEALDGLEYTGVTGSLTIDPETRQANKEVTLIGVTDGQYVYIDRFVPSYVPTVR